MGKVPTISIDKTDGCQMFLSKDSIDVEIITAKSSEMNVMIPNGEDFVSDRFILSSLGLKNHVDSNKNIDCFSHW